MAEQKETNKEKEMQNDSKELKKDSPKLEKAKKTEAIANGENLHASKKHCMYICDFIRGKSIDNAISDLESVIKMKVAIPFKGEIPHRKGDMMSGRYPVKASKLFITLLKGLKGNSIENGLDLDKTIIKTSSASWSSRPMRRGNVEAKRTNVFLVATELNSENKK